MTVSDAPHIVKTMSTRSRSIGTAAGMLAGVALDFMIPDPRKGHPVAGFGQAAGALERRVYADARSSGTVFTATSVGVVVAGAALVNRVSGRALPAVTAAATWAVLGGRSLRTEARAVESRLESGDLPAARERLTHLVGRDPSNLDENEISRAVIESVAENTCDAVVAPLFWGAVAGLPGLVGYRAVNTLDAMVGHRSPRYEKFGWASARLDDVANYVPARLSAGLIAAVSPSVLAEPAKVLRIVRRDGRRHPSPNSGMSEAAFAGALNRQLGGTNTYAGRVDERPVMGDGPPVTVADISRARRLATATTIAAGGAAVGIAMARRRPR
jgi:adenosylcobinamide-phosphate synthase